MQASILEQVTSIKKLAAKIDLNRCRDYQAWKKVMNFNQVSLIHLSHYPETISSSINAKNFSYFQTVILKVVQFL